MKITIKNEDIAAINESFSPAFPKYTSQLINWANQNAQGTRPKVVGQLSELFPQYMKQTESITPAGWEAWYRKQAPAAIDEATERIFRQMENLKQAILLIDRDMIRRWVEDLVIIKTFNGLYVQKAILAALADKKHLPYRLANPTEEAQGIDGYVGDTAYSVKPDTYKTMDRLPEIIGANMIYYTKTKTGLTLEVED